MNKILWRPITELPMDGYTCVLELSEFGVHKLDTGEAYAIADFHYCDGEYLWMTPRGYIPFKWISRWFPITYAD